MKKFINLRVFDNVPYIDREAVAALIREQMAPTIFQGAITSSAILPMATKLPDMTSHQTRLPILDALPMAYFLDADEAQKQTTTMKWKNKYINAAEIAVIVPFSQAAADDADYDLVGQVTPRLAEAAARAIDAAILFGTGKPKSWPDGVVTQAESVGAYVTASTNLYADLLGIGGTISKVEESGYDATGHVAAIGVKAALRGLVDTANRPLFLTSMQQAGNYTLAGAPITFPRNGAFDATKAKIVSGDFKQLVYAMRQDLTIDVFTEGVIQNPDGSIAYNLMQNDMFAIRMVMRLGWELPNPINGMNQTESRFPFAVLKGDLTRTSYNVPASTPVAAAPAGYSAEQLSGMTVDQIKSYAAGAGIAVTAKTKDAIVAEVLAAQANG